MRMQNRRKMKMIKVYVAGPYTKGDVAVNVGNAITAADELFDNGFAPYVPHLTHFWHMIYPNKYEKWLQLDTEFLLLCNVVLRLDGDSEGADKEVITAQNAGIPIYYSVNEIVEHFGRMH